LNPRDIALEVTLSSSPPEFYIFVWPDKGDLYMWGNARDCQLGVPDLPEVQPLPVKVNFLADGDEDPSPPHVISVAIGASHAMCLVSRQQID
jgi:alpha-tubulin suppressor-like RCC1 family protein